MNNNNINQGKLRVFRKESKYKAQDGSKQYWYSATRSDGSAVSCKFKCEVETDSVAFEISDVIGTMQSSVVVKNGVEYRNFTYYINACKFHEIEGDVLPL